jgi:hypothetical protein
MNRGVSKDRIVSDGVIEKAIRTAVSKPNSAGDIVDYRSFVKCAEKTNDRELIKSICRDKNLEIGLYLHGISVAEE